MDPVQIIAPAQAKSTDRKKQLGTSDDDYSDLILALALTDPIIVVS
jgi:hypothetical protein